MPFFLAYRLANMSYIGNTAQNQAYAPQIAYFSGNGSTTAFTLPLPVATAAQIIVSVANVIQNPSSSYTVSGNTITFTSAPASGSNNIWVQYTSPITQVIAPSNGTVNAKIKAVVAVCFDFCIQLRIHSLYLGMAVPTIIPFISLNCFVTSLIIIIAVWATAFVTIPENTITSIDPINKPIRTFGFAKFIS